MSMTGMSPRAEVRIERTCSLEEWKLYVATCPSATIYHLPEWSMVLEKSFGYKPFHLYARDKQGKLCGLLPLLLVSSPITGKRLVSLPFSYICGPIAGSDLVLISLLDEAKRLCTALKCRYLEIRTLPNKEELAKTNSLWLQNRFEVTGQFSTFMLNLSDTDTMWKKLDPKSVRWAIRKATKDGVIVRKTKSTQDIQLFYRLNLRTKRRIGVPGHPSKMFLTMFEKLGDACTLYMAEFQGAVVAGLIAMKFNDTVLYAYGASDDDYRKHQPNILLVWTAIEDSGNSNYKVFDFGRDAPSEQGCISFKKHWGTEETELAYYYYPRLPAGSLALHTDGLKYKLVSDLWKRMPLSLAQLTSNRIFRHLG
jgi:FemAB-related protein (PEP-CTERM system-associated)